jgi:hypothetical protein
LISNSYILLTSCGSKVRDLLQKGGRVLLNSDYTTGNNPFYQLAGIQIYSALARKRDSMEALYVLHRRKKRVMKCIVGLCTGPFQDLLHTVKIPRPTPQWEKWITQ